MNKIAYMNKVEPQQTEPKVYPVIEPPTLLGESPAMQVLLRAVQRVARSSMTVLINGETGTGKELAARALHCYSPRLETIHCAEHGGYSR